MAQSIVAKPKFVNTNAVVAGKETIDGVLSTLREARVDAQTTAMDALTNGDRKGVLTTMRIDGTYARAISSLEKAVLRAQRVRLTKEERKQFELNGALPTGYEQVLIDDEDEDDSDSDAE